jgi:hypothetical protein
MAREPKWQGNGHRSASWIRSDPDASGYENIYVAECWLYDGLLIYAVKRWHYDRSLSGETEVLGEYKVRAEAVQAALEYVVFAF